MRQAEEELPLGRHPVLFRSPGIDLFRVSKAGLPAIGADHEARWHGGEGPAETLRAPPPWAARCLFVGAARLRFWRHCAIAQTQAAGASRRAPAGFEAIRRGAKADLSAVVGRARL